MRATFAILASLAAVHTGPAHGRMSRPMRRPSPIGSAIEQKDWPHILQKFHVRSGCDFSSKCTPGQNGPDLVTRSMPEHAGQRLDNRIES